MEFKSKNGLRMFRCGMVNWQIMNKYAIDIPGEVNPEFYNMGVGNLEDSWSVSFIPENKTVSFTSYHYSNDEVYKFYAENLEEASEVALRFVRGMKIKDFQDTIYFNK